MTSIQPAAPAQTSRGLATSALVAGLLALACLLVLFTTVGGMTPLVLSSVLGAAAAVLGILALKHKQSRAFAVTGIVAGALSLVLGLGILLFALVFIGAIDLGL